MHFSFSVSRLETFIFAHRPWVIGFFLAVTLVMAYFAFQLRVDAGFSKLLPLQHEYMKTYMMHRQEFGGANRVLIACMVKKGDIFTQSFFALFKDATDEVFFIPGVDRAQVYSIFTPNVRFTEVVEDGISGGNVVPDDFRPTPEGLATVRKNMLKANIVGRLVANDFSGAIISAQLLEINPNTGEKLNYIDVAHELEEKLRAKFEARDENVTVHIIGFAKVIGDISDGAGRVVLFFAVSFIITALLVFFYTQSVKLTIIPLAASLMAVVWQLGMVTVLGFGMDPMGILVPFLIFAIGVSHGVQMVGAVQAELFDGVTGFDAARKSFRRLLVPGGIALASDTLGFITILLITVQIIQELAITASLGVAAIIFTNLILIPVLLSYLTFNARYIEKLAARTAHLRLLWRGLAHVTHPQVTLLVLVIAGGFLVYGLFKANSVQIGDLHSGVPELRANSQYNLDSRIISEKFSIGVDMISVIVETAPEGCIDYDIMTLIDRFAWHMQNVPGVQSVVSLPQLAKTINAGWNEGSMKWRILPRNRDVMVQAVAYVPTSSGLLNTDGSVMPVMIFTRDHRAQTISGIVSAVKSFRTQHGTEKVRFRLATGNVGVMAATNEEVAASQFPILMYLFSAIILLCLVTFRSVRATLCIVLPLGLVSILAYALMSALEIGLKVSTLPVVALGVGIGVDYGIYIYNRLESILITGEPLEEAFHRTLQITGVGVLFTGLTLGIGVATWIFSPLKFQADMGILLTFMFLVNMLGAIFLLPALARVLLPSKQ
ncbi:MAG: MMPL family transporter [Desulfobacterales bacterium]|jgi:predicted RND superfamily exporter protein|nr:MMPL family transporter [Desulfobacterales bacterium]